MHTSPETSRRVSSELLGVYEQKYRDSVSAEQACTDRADKDLASSVAVDATAKSDPALLREQLRSIGLGYTQVAGAIVSGYLPICAIPKLEGCCSELRLIRQSLSANQIDE